MSDDIPCAVSVAERLHDREHQARFTPPTPPNKPFEPFVGGGHNRLRRSINRLTHL
jgi:hypothetical protein